MLDIQTLLKSEAGIDIQTQLKCYRRWLRPTIVSADIQILLRTGLAVLDIQTLLRP